MKTLITIISAVLLSGIAMAQSSKFVPNPTADKFIGTWKATIEDKIIMLTLKKVKVVASNGVTVELLEGYHTFKKGNAMLDDTSAKPTLTSGSNYSETGVKYDDRFFFRYTDRRAKKNVLIELKFINGDNGDLSFTIIDIEQSHYRHNNLNENSERSVGIPQKLIFKRQN